MEVFIISIFALLFAGAHCSKIPSKPMSPEDKESLIEELEHSQMLKELEVLIKNLDDEQLDKLETILADNADDATEFDEIMEELIEMGMDKGDIEDLKQLAALMEEFLIQIPGINKKLEMKSDDDLSDNIQVGLGSLVLWYLELIVFLPFTFQLYLLGLPNKLGPLGYIALHHVLDGADDEDEHGDIVDVVIEPSSIAKIEEMEAKIAGTPSSSAAPGEALEDEYQAPTFRRRRSVASLLSQVPKQLKALPIP